MIANSQRPQYHRGDFVLYIIEIIGSLEALALIGISAAIFGVLPDEDGLVSLFSPYLYTKALAVNILLAALCIFTVITFVPLSIVKWRKVQNYRNITFALSIVFYVIELLCFCAVGILAAQTANEWIEVAQFIDDTQSQLSIGRLIAAEAAIALAASVTRGIICFLEIALYIHLGHRERQYDSI